MPVYIPPPGGGGGGGDHDTLTNVSPDDHHAQSHAHDGADSSGTVAHDDTTGVTANQHHTQIHALVGGDHTASGLAIGDVLTATSATAFAFQAATGGVHDLDDHGDVDAPTPADGDVLTWNNVDGEWQAAPAPGAGTGAATTLGFITWQSEASLTNERVLGVDYGPIFLMTPPVDGDFAWINQTAQSVTAAVVASAGGIHLSCAGHGVDHELRIRKKAAPAAPYTITAYIDMFASAKPFHGAGLCFRQSSDGKVHTFGLHCAGAPATQLASMKWADAGTFSAIYQNVDMGAMPHWLRIADDNTNRICSVSLDGQNWIAIHSVGRTDFLTADEVGFYINTYNSATPNISMALLLLSWAQA